ncbi:MAG TPA: FAD-dependent oxidoreductase [candidate division Zixibacteria bacterium]|nr:FAD-dependent oxidoreductase [candidate division Zixibacteria bacterium]
MIKLSRDRCVSCGGCVPICPEDALQIDNRRLTILSACTECGLCIPACPHGALSLKEPSALPEIRPADIEYDIAVIGGGPAGSTAAYFAALSGAKVLLLEKKPVVGIPQLCAEGISTSGLHDVFPDADPNWISAPPAIITSRKKPLKCSTNPSPI